MKTLCCLENSLIHGFTAGFWGHSKECSIN